MDFRDEFGRIPPKLGFYSNSIVEAYHRTRHEGGHKRVTALYAANSAYLATLFNGTVAVSRLIALAVLFAVICFGWGFFGPHWIWIGTALFLGVSAYLSRRARQAVTQIRTLILASEILASDFAGWGSQFPDAAEWARDWVSRTNTDIRLLDLYIPPDLRPVFAHRIQPPPMLEEKFAAKLDDAISMNTPKRASRAQTPLLLSSLLALGWGAYLGYQHTKLIPFLIITLSFAAAWLWFDREHVDTEKRPALAFTMAYISITLWSAGVMALAYWPVRLLYHRSDEDYGSHVIAAINYHNDAARITNKSCGTGVSCVLSPADWNAVYSYDEKALREARQADISDMNRIYPNFGDHFRNEFIDGLTLIVEAGNDSAKRPELIKGQILEDRYGDWYEANEDAIRSRK